VFFFFLGAINQYLYNVFTIVTISSSASALFSTPTWLLLEDYLEYCLEN